ncbi:helix-turn-helix domain-containing protein [Fuchsiella alkaliacetigena]|uniref:helix-turn-helix domain-containing protein n=1 Tax=Fuchsiella alkaliacetigena TaxID=957042 RepID=UPI00200AB21D|nr:helix-turn-helix transcriptional regulator [Fuchsiella alkaliacetigena]MCK8824880.1 helix-turn-helix domain-containing protein [Fuchsiella alkaliacetigena]
MSLAKRIKKLRKEFDLTQEKLAKKVGVSRATIAGYETKGKEPPYDTLTKLAEIFNVSTDYLLGLTDERKTAEKIKKALANNPELLECWEQLNCREDLQRMLKETQNLEPETIQRIIEITKIIE